MWFDTNLFIVIKLRHVCYDKLSCSRSGRVLDVRNGRGRGGQVGVEYDRRADDLHELGHNPGKRTKQQGALGFRELSSNLPRIWFQWQGLWKCEHELYMPEKDLRLISVPSSLVFSRNFNILPCYNWMNHWSKDILVTMEVEHCLLFIVFVYFTVSKWWP